MTDSDLKTFSWFPLSGWKLYLAL